MAGGADVVASVDRSADEPLFVIADVTAEGVWITTPMADAVTLDAHR